MIVHYGLGRGSIDHVKGRFIFLNVQRPGLDLDHVSQAGTAVEVFQQQLDGLVLALHLALDLSSSP